MPLHYNIGVIERIHHILKNICQIDPNKLLLVGVSGGPDSLFLLDILYQLKFNICVAHLDHELRPESPLEAASVREISRRLNIPFVIESQDVAGYAQAHGLSTEHAARNTRYEFLFRQASLLGAQAVAVAHTADDQIETILLHLLRGTGLQGLTGMQYYRLPNPWSQTIPLIRPVLDIWRQEILEHLALTNLKPHLDKSNEDTSFMRNRIRHDLIPILEEYNPRLQHNLHQMADILRQDHLCLQEVEMKKWNECLRVQGAGYVGLDKARFLNTHPAIQRRLIRIAFQNLLPDLMDIEFLHIHKTINFINEPTSNRHLQVTSGVEIQIEKDLIYILRENISLPNDQWPLLTGETDIILHFPGSITLGNGWKLDSKIIDHDSQTLSAAQLNQELYHAWLDYDQLSFPMHLRTRLPGDRFQPLGMLKGSQKISDFFINHKLPARVRPYWPILSSPIGISWVPGFQIANSLRVTQRTKKVLFLKLIQE